MMSRRHFSTIRIFSRRDDAQLKPEKPSKRECELAAEEQKKQWEEMIKSSGIQDDEWIEIPDWEPPSLQDELLYWKNKAEKLQHQFNHDEKLIQAENERDKLLLRVNSLETQLILNGIKPRDE